MSNLIDLAKMETGNLELFYKSVLLKDLVEEVKTEMDEMSSLYEKGHLSLTYEAPADSSVRIFSDKGRLFQIIKILMENSLRFTREGSISLLIKQTSPSIFTIEVNDTGCGIDKDTLRNLFEIFPPADPALGKKMKVRGMSLSVVKRLCDMMDVFIEVTSQVGVGTRVKLTVPSNPV
jgi:signal transduction histidine kinase